MAVTPEQRAEFYDTVYINGGVEVYRAYYRNQTGKETTLTDDEIIEMVMLSEDDDDQEGWTAKMVELENKNQTASAA